MRPVPLAPLAQTPSHTLPGERFGERFRPYVTHEAKAASRALLHELGTVWAAPFGATAAHPFRETKGGESDPSALFMLVHFVVERWREGLLWAWAVAKHGAPDDAWAPAAAGAAWRELGGEEGVETLSVRAARRATLDPERVEAQLRGSGHRQADSTTYEFCELRARRPPGARRLISRGVQRRRTGTRT